MAAAFVYDYFGTSAAFFLPVARSSAN